MCGEIDESIQIGQDLLDRFTVMSKMLGFTAEGQGGGAPEKLASAAGRAAYMEQLFKAGLTRALNDAHAADEDETVDAIASQAIAFARLAGFIAGQLPPEADLFRSVIEALTMGHAETGRLAHEYRHAQADAHGHDHSHDHHH